MRPIIPQLKATDNPYSEAAVLKIVNDSCVEFVEGKITGNNEAKEDVIPPIMSSVESIKL